MPEEAATLHFADLREGFSVEFSVDLLPEMITQFAELSGDKNPLHVDPVYAATTPFHGCIAHGLLGASFISRLIGMYLPGRDALYLSQELFFRAPMYAGMRLVVRGVVLQRTEATRTITISTEVFDEKTHQLLIGGKALVKLLA